jgi:hypothetical protein
MSRFGPGSAAFRAQKKHAFRQLSIQTLFFFKARPGVIPADAHQASDVFA